MRLSIFLAVLQILSLNAVGAPGPALAVPAAEERRPAALRLAKFAEIDAAIVSAISNRALPGAVIWLEREGFQYHRAYGQRAVLPVGESMTEDTVFDAASLTKVLATTPAVMLLMERGQVDLNLPAQRYLPEFTGEGRDAITVRHLLTHTSGLRSGIGIYPDWKGFTAGIQRALAERPEYTPGTRFRYSDVNFILLGELVRRVSGRGLDDFCATQIFGPLGMTDTGFRPAASLKSRIAPTTLDSEGYLRGVVHDPTSRRMGGVAGHAGLFTTARDVAKLARMMLDLGSYPGGRLFQPSTIHLMTQVETPPEMSDARRGLGWDIDSPYAGPRGDVFPVGSYGHTGWTGTSLWIDPFSRTFIILMSNRNHPTEDGSVISLRRRLGTLAAEAVEGFNFAGVPGALPRQTPGPGNSSSATTSSSGAATVRNGIDVLVAQGFAPLRGLKIGLITNHTGTDRDRNPTIDLLKNAPEVELKALFSPEHGIRGVADEKIPDTRDSKTGLPIFSLYGENLQPTGAQLLGLDALVFDIQDVGARFYTYVSSMGLCLQAASKHHLRFLVLDRVNPINGAQVEGPVYTGTTNHFVCFHAIPIRHGMTAGELALMFNSERGWNAPLTVIPVEGWHRDQWFDETGLPWTPTSPNLRNLKQAILYPGVGLLESAVSVGRGTDSPFEVVGAPYVNDRKWAAELNRAMLPGIRFVPIRFTPKSNPFKDQECGGIYLLLTDRNACRVVDVGIQMALTLQRMYPQQFDIGKMERLLQHRPTLEAIRAGKTLLEIKALWSTDLGEFHARRSSFLLY